MTQQKFEYVTVSAQGKTARKGGQLLEINENGWGIHAINGKKIVEVIRRGNSTVTVGGATSVGYQFENMPETRQKTLKKLFEVYA